MANLNDSSINPAVIKYWENLDPKIRRFTDSFYPDMIRSLQIEASSRIRPDFTAGNVDQLARDAVKATIAGNIRRSGEEDTLEERGYFIVLESIREDIRTDARKTANKER